MLDRHTDPVEWPLMSFPALEPPAAPQAQAILGQLLALLTLFPLSRPFVLSPQLPLPQIYLVLHKALPPSLAHYSFSSCPDHILSYITGLCGPILSCPSRQSFGRVGSIVSSFCVPHTLCHTVNINYMKYQVICPKCQIRDVRQKEAGALSFVS